MADTEDTPDTAAPETDEVKPEVGADDIKKMRAALKKANDEAAASRLKLKELEDRDKSESDKLSERISAAEKRAEESEAKALRLEVAASKGLTPAQARRLVGATQEELESDADELLSSFSTPEPKVPPVGDSKPQPKLQPGSGDPDAGADEIDYDALARKG